jgi:arylsulfatase A-like enzyme
MKFLPALASLALLSSPILADAPPNVLLVMTDDQGWGQAGFRGHPLLKTPALDAMARDGLRLDRFYAASPVCSPTRASVLTGRAPDRTGVVDHGHALRRQERTLPQALKEAGYATAHFGKWHLNAVKGPGVPVLASSPHHPGHFGFDEWVSSTNYFDRDPMLSRNGVFEHLKGDSSEVIVREAERFIRESAAAGRPFFATVWFGSPHDPFVSNPGDMRGFEQLDKASQHHHGELVAMDRSLGRLRQSLRDLGVAENTIVWFCSDNGGLEKVKPDTVGGLRGFKGSLFEGGIRVPAVVEWPRVIRPGRVTDFPASTVDIFPTIAAAAGLPPGAWTGPCDGTNLLPLFEGAESVGRTVPMAFRFRGNGALIDGNWKLRVAGDKVELFDLAQPDGEKHDLSDAHPERRSAMLGAYRAWSESVDRSAAGADYPGGLARPDPTPVRWTDMPEYAEHLEKFFEILPPSPTLRSMRKKR